MSIRVSICTTVLNQSEWLKEMIASVVQQTFKSWELIIMDDGSTEDIRGVVESFEDQRIQYHRSDENIGGAKQLNKALDLCDGEFISFLSADEVIDPQKLEQQVAYLDEHQGVDCLWGLPGQGDLGQREGWEQYWLKAHNRSREHWLRTLLNLDNVPIGSASMLMRRKTLNELGKLDESLTLFNDHELFCRFFTAGKVGRVLPFRWAVEKTPGPDSVRAKNHDKAATELAYVRSKYPLILPKSTGKVTIGIPCFNHAKYLPDAVNSVLSQTYQDFELMILNDGSKDNFDEVVAQFSDPRIKVFAFPENMGIDEAANYMSFRAEGDFYVTLAADDVIEPTLLEKCLAEFQKNPWVEFVGTCTDFMDENKVKQPESPMLSIPRPRNRLREEWLQELHTGNHYFGVGMFRRSALLEVGGWDKRFKVISDYEMYLKILQRDNIAIVEEDLTHTRIDGSNRSILRGFKVQELPWLYHEAKKQYYRPLMKVVIATPFYELKGFSPYITSLLETTRLLTQCGIDWRYMELSGDSYVHRARNTMCDMFLADPDATDLFFIDSDMAWNPDAFVKICMLPDPIVGGSYPVKNGWENWTSIPMMYEEEGKHHYKGRELGDGTALLEAHVLAGGFLRIKRQVLEKYREHYSDMWYQEPSTDPNNPERRFTEFFVAEKFDHKFYGEDHAFSKRLREMGIRMMIYPNATISHFGVKGWTGNFDTYLKDQKKLNAPQPTTQ